MSNKIQMPQPAPNPKPQMGDLFTDEAHTSLYILACIGGFGSSPATEWVAISLSEGNRWSQPTQRIGDAVSGLKFLGRDMNIVATYRK